MKVGDLLSNNQFPKVNENVSLIAVIVEISSKRLGATAVLNDAGDLIEIIADGDLRRMLQKTISSGTPSKGNHDGKSKINQGG